MARDPASFRDPAGHVHHRDGRVFRSILPPGIAHYLAARESGFLERATNAGRLIGGVEVDPQVFGDEAEGILRLIEHPRLDFISYPYEWSFSGLRDAALLTLDLHLDALDSDLTMSDGSAYNIQFVGFRPLFIDYLSFLRYEPGQVWLGYRQFCEQFLNPLLLSTTTGVSFQPLLRGSGEGIRASDLKALLPWRTRLDPRIALHVVLQGRLQGKMTEPRVALAKRIRLSKTALQNNLRAMRGWIAGLRPRGAAGSPWEQYEQAAQYTPEERGAKAEFVRDLVARDRPQVVWDLGCNAGEYAELVLRSGAAGVVGFEPDPGALEAAYRRAVAKQLNFLPLAMDLTNPSPSQGWRQRERAGLAERGRADAVLCLALLHHLVIGRSLPLDQVLDWVCGLAPRGVVEFVPKEDPMAQRLLALKPDGAPDYSRETVAALLGRSARIVREQVVTSSGRVLFAFERP